jgi:hypothetical protein
MRVLKLTLLYLTLWALVAIAALLTVKCSSEKAVTMAHQPLETYFPEGIDSVQFTILGRKGENELVDLGIDTEQYPVNTDADHVQPFRTRFPKDVQGMVATYCNYKYREGLITYLIGVPVFITPKTLLEKEEAYFRVRIIEGQKIFVETD